MNLPFFIIILNYKFNKKKYPINICIFLSIKNNNALENVLNTRVSKIIKINITGSCLPEVLNSTPLVDWAFL